MVFKEKEINTNNIFDIIKYNLDVTHKEKGRIYNVVMVLKSKDRTTGEWYRSVLYKHINGEHFVRSLDDFCKQFEVKEERDK